MREDFEEKYHLLEEQNYWFLARRDMILRLIHEKKNTNILDIGCSGGVLMLDLKKKGYNVIKGFDISEKAVELSHKRGLKTTYVCDAEDIKEVDCCFDVAISSDVLEHILDHENALREWKRILKPKGKLMVFVPAFQMLWSSHDKANMHQRRYTKKQLVSILRMLDFKILRAGYWNFSSFIPSLITKFMDKLHSRPKKDQLFDFGPKINGILTQILKLENYILSKGVNFPLGVSVFAIAQKK
ncbi:MAG: class I SAM-dependent methyltransferase [Candidatus Hodarchaeota archaeon]